MGFFDKISKGLMRSRNKFRENVDELLERGGALDTEFWDGLEEALVMSDMGGVAACKIVLDLEDEARGGAFKDTYGAFDRLYNKVADTFTPAERDIFSDEDALILFVGINGTGKTTTVGKIAKSETDAGRKVILGSADTFRAAAIEQLEVWAKRANVEMVTRERGADPASVCYDTIERAEVTGAQLVLIDTAGRLHTSNDLMRELQKVVQVTRKRSQLPVYTVLVIDATTGQNGMAQARQFNDSLDLDGLVVTKLDGTAKGGIALAASHEMGLPIYRIGVGEGIEDLRPFDAHDYARALLGDFDVRNSKEDAKTSEKSSSQSSEDDTRNAKEDAKHVAKEDAQNVENDDMHNVEDSDKSAEEQPRVEDFASEQPTEAEPEEVPSDMEDHPTQNEHEKDEETASDDKPTSGENLSSEVESEQDEGADDVEVELEGELTFDEEANIDEELAAEEGLTNKNESTDEDNPTSSDEEPVAEDNLTTEKEPDAEPEEKPKKKKSFWKRLFS